MARISSRKPIEFEIQPAVEEWCRLAVEDFRAQDILQCLQDGGFGAPEGFARSALIRMPIPSVRSHFRSSSTGHAGRQQAALRSRGCSQASLQKQSLRLVLLGCFWSVGLLTAMKMPSEASHRLFFNCLDVSGAARSG